MVFVTKLVILPFSAFFSCLLVLSMLRPNLPQGLEKRNDSCPGFKGNPDFYGLGVRIGVYLQWFSSLSAYYIEEEEVEDMDTANFVLGFSLLLAITVAAVDRAINLVEVYVMILMCFGFIILIPGFLKIVYRQKLINSTIKPGKIQPEKPQHAGPKFSGRWAHTLNNIVEHVRWLYSLNWNAWYFNALSIWICWSFATPAMITPIQSCPSSFYLFGLRTVNKNSIQFFRIISVVSMALITVKAAAPKLLILFATTRHGNKHQNAVDPQERNGDDRKSDSSEDSMHGISQDTVQNPTINSDSSAALLLKAIIVVEACILLAGLACLVAFIEATISAADMDGVYDVRSTGQLLPFVIGIYSFYNILRKCAGKNIPTRTIKFGPTGVQLKQDTKLCKTSKQPIKQDEGDSQHNKCQEVDTAKELAKIEEGRGEKQGKQVRITEEKIP